mmetsp:Transcript_14870/g.22509  ORF Transcript_14870/g.22509 Transcript_14870/m.22509 type:complete len:80 (+) Transcript_14870:4404-4643(+)
MSLDEKNSRIKEGTLKLELTENEDKLARPEGKKLMGLCLKYDKNMRPTAKALLECIRKLQQECESKASDGYGVTIFGQK